MEHPARLPVQRPEHIVHLRCIEAHRMQQFEQQVLRPRFAAQGRNVDGLPVGHHPPPGLFQSLVIHHRHVGQAPGRLGNRLADRRVEGLQQRNHVQPELVAHELVLQVRAVSHIVLSQGRQILQNLRPAHAQERTHHFAVHGTDALQAVDARAPHQVEQERLHTVVAVMGHCHHLRPAGPEPFGKPAVTQFPRRHLDGNAPRSRIRLRIEVRHLQRYSQPFGQVAHKPLVAHRLLPAEVKVTMSRLTRIPQLEQHPQQCHRVGPAAQRHQHLVAPAKQVLLFDKLTDFPCKHVANLGIKCEKRSPEDCNLKTV